MLSIVKLDLDTDDAEDGDMDTQEHYSMEDGDSIVMDSLALVPVVYTTRLEDMTVLNHSAGLHPSEITARILNESKPFLLNYPSNADDRTRSRKSAFRSLKRKLNTIYKRNNNLTETTDLKPDIASIQFEECVIKHEESEESNYCKYIKLLKLCRPVSVVLTKMIEFPAVGDPLEEKKIQNETVTVISSSDTDDDEPLVNKIPTKSYSKKVNTNKPDQPTPAVKLCDDKPNNSNTTAPSNEAADSQHAFLNFTGNRLLLNGLMEMHDFYSQEFNSYITDAEGLLIDYYTDHIKNISKYKSIENHAETRLTFLNCCWVQRDQYIRSMYPKVLMYTNFRFMRKHHMCPLGKCKCCCRNKKEFLKPNLHVANNNESVSATLPYNKEDLEIQALEDEIARSINTMNKKASRLDTEWIRTYLSTPESINPLPRRPTSLITKALHYRQRLPKKKRDNRQLLTIKNRSLRFHVLTFRNFASDLKEIYEVDSYGELLSYMKVPCFTNTTRPDIKKLTSDSESVRDVCCWFKRELFVTQLLLENVVTHSSAKFIRSRHTCSIDACSCCCKPTPNKFGRPQLCDIKISSQLPSWQAIQENKSITITSCNTTAEQELPKSKSQAIPETVKLGAVTSSNTVAKQASSKNKRYLEAEKGVPIGPDFWRKYSRIVPRTTLSANDKPTNTTAMPVLRPLLPKPTPPKAIPLPPEQVRHIANVIQGEEMSGEVNTLIMSILERFKDVRLTISGDGKVQAALNMPVHTLSTVELKVLANILSYAQSQINLLGLNSGMSLSSVINMKNDITNKNSENTVPSVSTPPSSYFSVLDEASTKEAYEYFTKTLSVKNNAFKGPFSSFLAKKLNVPDSQKLQNETVSPVIENETARPVIEDEMVTPVIENVFSLKKEDVDETKQNTSTLWYNKPDDKSSDDSGSVMKVFTYNNKRTQDETSSGAMKRIKVASSSNLASPNTMDPTPNVVYKPAPLLNSGTPEVGNLVPGVPLLSNPNFQLVVNPKAQLLGMNTLVIPSSNPPMLQVPAGPSLERTLVITPLPPLNTYAPLPTVAVVNNGNASQFSGVSGTANTAGVAPGPIVSESMPIQPESPSDIIFIKSEDDDCCILGM